MTSLPAWVAIGCLALYGSARPGLRRDLHGLALLPVLAWVAVFGLALPGCKDTDRRYVVSPFASTCPNAPTPAPPPAPVRQVGDSAPRKRTTTPRGVRVDYPVWLDLHPAQFAAMLAEIDSVTPEADPRIDPSLRGVPPADLVIVLDPGAYYAPYSPTGLALGEWNSVDLATVLVAWRGHSGDSRTLPALAHELRHRLTGDPLAGH